MLVTNYDDDDDGSGGGSGDGLTCTCHIFLHHKSEQHKITS